MPYMRAEWKREQVATLGRETRVEWTACMSRVSQKLLWLTVGIWQVACSPCDRWEEVLATDAQGRSVISELEACTSIGTSLSETIELRSAHNRSATILKYAPGGGQAGCKWKMFPRAREGNTVKVDWSNPAVIHISIGVVSSIVEKIDEVDGVRVTYDIGTVISKACKD
jgi:hypothetical protein